MAYDGKLLARARDELDKIREENRAEQQRRLARAYARLPELEEVDAAMRSQMTELVRLTVSRRPDLKQRIEELKQRNLDTQRRRAELLSRGGFAPDYLDEIYSCPLCRDTGIYQGGVCSCLDRLYNRELTKELGTLMRRGDESFERFDLSLYPNTPDPVKHVVPRETMALTCAACRRFAENFSAASPNLLLQGGTGLGKTYLMHCIGNALADRGFTVLLTSAYQLNQAVLSSWDADRLDLFLGVDLLLIDDLGAEPLLQKVTGETLFTLVNERQNASRAVILSTNLNRADIARRYGERFLSRITDRRCASVFLLEGGDLRQR